VCGPVVGWSVHRAAGTARLATPPPALPDDGKPQAPPTRVQGGPVMSRATGSPYADCSPQLLLRGFSSAGSACAPQGYACSGHPPARNRTPEPPFGPRSDHGSALGAGSPEATDDVASTRPRPRPADAAANPPGNLPDPAACANPAGVASGRVSLPHGCGILRRDMTGRRDLTVGPRFRRGVYQPRAITKVMAGR
jgi:hypothetical protein